MQEALHFVVERVEETNLLLDYLAHNSRFDLPPSPFDLFHSRTRPRRMTMRQKVICLWYISYTDKFVNATLEDFLTHVAVLKRKRKNTPDCDFKDHASRFDLNDYLTLVRRQAEEDLNDAVKYCRFRPQSGKEDDNLWSSLSTDTKIAWASTIALAVAVPAGAPITIATGGLIKHVGTYATLATVRNLGGKIGTYLKSCKEVDDESVQSSRDDLPYLVQLRSKRTRQQLDPNGIDVTPCLKPSGLRRMVSQSGMEDTTAAMMSAMGMGPPTAQEVEAREAANGRFSTETKTTTPSSTRRNEAFTVQQTNADAWHTLNEQFGGAGIKSSNKTPQKRSGRPSNVGGL